MFLGLSVELYTVFMFYCHALHVLAGCVRVWICCCMHACGVHEYDIPECVVAASMYSEDGACKFSLVHIGVGKKSIRTKRKRKEVYSV